jgi:sulfate transport system permease protein
VSRLALRFAALGYLAALLLAPVGLVFYRTFEHGVGAVYDSITTPAAISAFWLTLEVAVIAVVANTVFGVIAALALARGKFRGKWLLDALIDLPFAVSPVVIGLALVLVYGRNGWIELPFQVIFSVPGIVLATIFVSLPFVVREVTPVLREIGDEQEQAAATLGASRAQSFLRVTLPAIRYGIAYGVVISTARAIGEFGSVVLISGNIPRKTEVAPVFIFGQIESDAVASAAAVSVVLLAISLVVLIAIRRLSR